MNLENDTLKLNTLPTDEYKKPYIYNKHLKAKIYEINGEKVVVMDEFHMLAKPKFNNSLDQNYYIFLNKKLNKVYPLFLIALQQYRDTQKEMSQMSKKNRRKYAKTKQKELANQYENQLRDLTVSEGQIFAKLMNRATGKTVYEIIQELRGSWSAFWWNIKGSLTNISLKKHYDPNKNRDDEYIENLLISGWRSGYLKPYENFEAFKSEVKNKP